MALDDNTISLQELLEIALALPDVTEMLASLPTWTGGSY